MSHQDHNPSKRRFIQGAAAVMLLSISPFGFLRVAAWWLCAFGLHPAMPGNIGI